MTNLDRQFAALVLLALPVLATAQDVREAAREVLAAKGDAVITIQVVTESKFAYQGNQSESEDRIEIIGTVISEEGLAVTSLSSVDPSHWYDKLRSRDEEFSYQATVKDIKYILSDNREIPATVVLRDNELDLAFLRPTEPVAEPLSFVDLSDSRAAEMLEPVFTIGRMGRIARRTPLGMTGEIQGIVDRPRAYYIPSGEVASAGMGVPVFTADGKVSGLMLNHFMPGGQNAATSGDELIISVVLPADQIVELLPQVPPREKSTTPAETGQ